MCPANRESNCLNFSKHATAARQQREASTTVIRPRHAPCREAANATQGLFKSHAHAPTLKNARALRFMHSSIDLVKETATANEKLNAITKNVLETQELPP